MFEDEDTNCESLGYCYRTPADTKLVFNLLYVFKILISSLYWKVNYVSSGNYNRKTIDILACILEQLLPFDQSIICPQPD